MYIRMTAIWGPMGWMTLHSISVCYPMYPSSEDIAILNQFMDAFKGSITCPHCKDDFESMFLKYKIKHPEWNISKYHLFLSIVRMHNTVNKKLNKPSPKSVSESLEFLRNATKYTSQKEFREKYIEHVFRNWISLRNTGSHATLALQNAGKMQKINSEYWDLREGSYDIELPESDIFFNTTQYNPGMIRPQQDMASFVKKMWKR
jgi:hypothetical protein